MTSSRDVVEVLRQRRARTEADLRSFRTRLSVARAELDALDAAIDLLAADPLEGAREGGGRNADEAGAAAA